ncbi:MAG: putative bifunctional diguanylate cyclase/phosphodiesterase [Candidatus Limnocylindria bacterium]
MQRHERADYTALSERMTRLLALRISLALIVIAWSAIGPRALGAPFATLVGVTGGYVVASVFFEWARRRAGRVGFAILSVLLLLDGLYLAYAMYATGGTQSPMRFLTYLHLVAVSLLASYRTGLKIALWHSLLLFVVLYAQAAQLLPAIDVQAGREVAFDSLPVLNVTSFWLFAFATSVFSAMNERELRQRRADLEALVDVGARLDDVGDPVEQARIVLDAIVGRFAFERGIVVGASEDKLVLLAAHGAAPQSSAPTDVDAVVMKAWNMKEPVAVSRVGPRRNPLLAAALPSAHNLLVIPMIADARPVGAIVVEQRVRSVVGVERRVTSVLAQFAAVAALNLRNAALLRHVQDLAERDSLTGAANRRMFQLALERVLTSPPPNRAPAEDVTAVLFIDLDDFKMVNDNLGHGAGDALLVGVTERISALVRENDLVARLGGDEFAILTDDGPDLKRSRAMAERLVRDLRAPYLIGRHHVTVSASIGIAAARDESDTASEVVRNADVAMYMAKANGKAGFAIFDPGMHAAIRERHELGVQLQRAVDLAQLRLVYQPIMALDTGKVAGLEALLRWEHPDRGLVPPDQFISIAEENGAIVPIGRWVLREACEDAGRWQRSGVTDKDIFLCVNVSAREIQQPGFVPDVHNTLKEAGVDPARLILEISETALLKATPSTVATLESLRDLGVRIVIDDFGTGYFSLSHLRQFPVDALKIASEFVQIAESDSRSSVLASAIVALSESLEIETIAEGIETQAHADRMRSLGCRYGQGYFFAAPLAGEEIAAGLEHHVPAPMPQSGQTSVRRARQRRRSRSAETPLPRRRAAARPSAA